MNVGLSIILLWSCELFNYRSASDLYSPSLKTALFQTVIDAIRDRVRAQSEKKVEKHSHSGHVFRNDRLGKKNRYRTMIHELLFYILRS